MIQWQLVVHRKHVFHFKGFLDDWLMSLPGNVLLKKTVANLLKRPSCAAFFIFYSDFIPRPVFMTGIFACIMRHILTLWSHVALSCLNHLRPRPPWSVAVTCCNRKGFYCRDPMSATSVWEKKCRFFLYVFLPSCLSSNFFHHFFCHFFYWKVQAAR